MSSGKRGAEVADDSRIPPGVDRSPDPDRPYLKITEAARRMGLSRKALIRQVARTPSSAWVDVSGQRVKWFFYADGLPAGPPDDRIAELAAELAQVREELEQERRRRDAAELADLRARVLRAEASNALLLEAYELLEAAGQRFRQALTLHTTPGHAGELSDAGAVPKPAGGQ